MKTPIQQQLPSNVKTTSLPYILHPSTPLFHLLKKNSHGERERATWSCCGAQSQAVSWMCCGWVLSLDFIPVFLMFLLKNDVFHSASCPCSFWPDASSKCEAHDILIWTVGSMSRPVIDTLICTAKYFWSEDLNHTSVVLSLHHLCNFLI